jgi:hypothetical protein
MGASVWDEVNSLQSKCDVTYLTWVAKSYTLTDTWQSDSILR